jgi:hypothetical protein
MQWRCAARMAVLGATLFGAAACQTVSSINPFGGTQEAPVASSPAMPQPRVETGDPLLRVVGTLPLRTDQSFQEPATGAVLRVEVMRIYEAASGRSCREYLVTDPAGRQQNRVACRMGDRWVHARPLRIDGPAGDTQVQ